jgi:hypothetical protein
MDNSVSRESMRVVAWLSLAVVMALHVLASAHAQTPADSLRAYAVNVVKTPPFQKQFTGYGVYLGQGFILTAAHVVGHWPVFTHPRVRVAGQDLPAKVIKKGSFEQIDLALLSVDQARLPVSLRLRRNPLCTQPPAVGMDVIDVTPEAITRLQVISPLVIPAALRKRFDTLITRPQESGSGIFDAERKCLLGIASAKVEKYRQQIANGKPTWWPDGFAGYFVPAAQIATFLPADVRY